MGEKLHAQPEVRRKKPKFPRLLSAYTALVVSFFGSFSLHSPNIINSVGVREVMAEPIMKLSKADVEKQAVDAVGAFKNFLLKGDEPSRNKFFDIWNKYGSNDDFWNKFVEGYMGNPKLGIPGEIVGRNKMLLALHNAYKSAKGKMVPIDFATAAAHCYEYLNKTQGHLSAAKLQNLYGSFFNDFMSLKGFNVQHAADSLLEYSKTGDALKLNEFMRVWQVAVPDYSKQGKREKDFIIEFGSELAKKSKELASAALAYGRISRQRFPNYAAFAKAIQGATADLKNQKPAAKIWMEKKYTSELVTYLANQLYFEKAANAVKYLETFISRPKDMMFQSRFLKEWQGSNVGFSIAFHSKIKSSKISMLMLEYEKKKGQVNDVNSARSFIYAVESVYDTLRSGSAQVAHLYSKYGQGLVNTIRSGTLVTVPKKLYKKSDVKADLDIVEERLESLEKYFKELKMNQNPRVRSYLNRWSDQLSLARAKLEEEKISFNELFERAKDLRLNIPPMKYVKMVITTADMDIRNIDRIYLGKKSYSYTITEGWISRMESLIKTIDSTRGMAALDWVYNERMKMKVGDIDAIKTQVGNLKVTVSFIQSTLAGLTSIDTMKEQMTSLEQSINDLTIPLSSSFKTDMFGIIGQSKVIIDASSLNTTRFWEDQIRLIENLLNKLPGEFRERVAIQFYSKWHEEKSGVQGYRSIGAALNQIVMPAAAFKSQIDLILPQLSIENKYQSAAPGVRPAFTTATLNANGEIYNSFKVLPIETQYELSVQFTTLFGASPTYWDNDTWAKFAAAVNGISELPGSHGPLLLKRLGPKLLKQHPNTIYTVLQAVSSYSRVFYPGGHYQELSAYYESLPPKLDKMFTDIFSLKDQIKEQYNDVRIIKPTEQDQYYNLLIPAARIIVQIPKHVYQEWTNGGMLLEKREASKVYKSASPPPNIPATEMRFFNEKVIEGRLNLPRPAIVPILALNKLHLLAPNYIPEVGEWYGFLGTQQVMSAWEKQQSGDTKQESWQAMSRTSLAMTGEGKNLTGTYSLQRGSGTKSTDEGQATFRNLSFNENRLPNAWLIDLEEFKKTHPTKSQQSAIWKRLSDQIQLRVVKPVPKLAQPKSAEGSAIAGILDSVSSFSAKKITTGGYNVTAISERGMLFDFETKEVDLSSEKFRSDFFSAIKNLKSDDVKRFRKLRLHTLADSIHAFRSVSEKGDPLSSAESIRVINSRLRRIEENTIDEMLSSLGSVYFEPVKVRGKNAYLAEVRMGTTALFNFTTTSIDPTSKEFRQEFWRSISELDPEYVRGLIKGKGVQAFVDSLSTFNSMNAKQREDILARNTIIDKTTTRLALIAIPLSTGKRSRKTSTDLAKNILEKMTISEVKSGEYEITVGEAKDKVVVGSFSASDEAQIRKQFSDIMQNVTPEQIKTKGLSNSKYMGKLWKSMFGAGRNAVDGDIYVRREDDRLTKIRTGITALAPGGADTAIYFDRTYQGTTGESQASSIADRLNFFISNKTETEYNNLISQFNSEIQANTSLKDSSLLKQFNLSDSEIDALGKKMNLDSFKGIVAKARDDVTNKLTKDKWTSTSALKNSLVEDHHLYDAYIFKRIENGSFALVDVKTLNKSQVEQTYQTIKPEADLAQKLYSRLHPVMGKAGEAELEGSLIFAGDKTEKQGFGAAYQLKKWGGYYLHELTRGGRLSAGIASMNPDKRRYWVGRFYHSNIEAKTVRTKRGTIETEKGYHVQGTYLEADKLRIEAFAGKQSIWEYAGIGDYIHDKFYLGGGFARLRERTGGYGYIMDKNMINAAVVSGFGQNGQLQALAGGGRAVLGQLNLEIRAGGIGQRDVGKGGFLQLTYFPDRTFLGFRSFSGLGAIVRGERDLSIGGVELGGQKLEVDAYFNPTGGAGELKLHFPRLDLVAGGAGGMENIAKWAAWGGARIKLDSATLFGVASAGREITLDSEDVISKEFMAGGRLLLSPGDYRFARSWYGIAGFSGIFQDVGQEWGRQFDFQAGMLGNSFYDQFTVTAGYQNWENKYRVRDSLTMQAVYDRRLALWIFRDLTFSASAAVGRDLTKDPEWSRAFIQFLMQMRGTF